MPQVFLNFRNKKLKKNYKFNNLINNNDYCFLYVVFFFILLSTIIMSGWSILNWIKDINITPISRLVITGERQYTQDDNIKKLISSLSIYNTYMGIDINKIRHQIKNIPWIKQVSVRKLWPNELRIHIVEYKPYAKWNDNFFINEEGIIFSLPVVININSNLPMLYGPKNSEQDVLKMYRIMNQQLSLYNFNIKSLSMTVLRSWQVILSNDMRLNIGKDNIKDRLNRFIVLYPLLQKVTDKRIGYIDLRYSSRAAVGWLP
ncbi:Cell division protein FtsQ [Candidatus Arsenophonus lipoptenae]|uniref:Cell division protein FtsQ n=1 Tax=Candidatus Arsenophonus lipoptenae TaxID=634113 RepID=A0A0X9VZK5_9GAMM|nr:cell division protein FtsQ/DivIB [Candidatus Arsenophonus lipoptenae]AMA65105.1 Cell division protein FtsQ [Candidatus Arsenophonus lipoptenae]